MNTNKNMTKTAEKWIEKWEKDFDKLCIEYMADDFVDVDWWKNKIKNFIKTLISATAKNAREELIKKIDYLIADEILICCKENEKTSRLTSLAVKIKKLD